MSVLILVAVESCLTFIQLPAVLCALHELNYNVKALIVVIDI